MTYICLECGHIFDEGEQYSWQENHGFSDGLYENHEGCPLCHGGFEEAHKCQHCDSEYHESTLYEGWCEECLRDTLTYENCLKYLEDTDALVEFMMVAFYQSSLPSKVSPKLQSLMHNQFLHQMTYDAIHGTTSFLKLCQRYIMDDDGNYGRQDYAEWLIAQPKKEVI